jgi:hypothetical protein
MRNPLYRIGEYVSRPLNVRLLILLVGIVVQNLANVVRHELGDKVVARLAQEPRFDGREPRIVVVVAAAIECPPFS